MIQSLLEFRRRIQIILEQKLDSAFPRFTSFTHQISMKRRAGKSK
jgi:hypothetical protein